MEIVGSETDSLRFTGPVVLQPMNKGAVIYNVNDHDIRAKANLQLGSVTKVHAKHAEQVSHASLITRKPITSHSSCFSSTVLSLISTLNSS